MNAFYADQRLPTPTVWDVRQHHLHPVAAMFTLAVLIMYAAVASAGTISGTSGGTISGIIYFDPINPGPVVTLNAPPMAGWPVRLAGDTIRDTVTAADGTFSFTELVDGDYTVSTQGTDYTVAVSVGEVGGTVVEIATVGWQTFLAMVTGD